MKNADSWAQTGSLGAGPRSLHFNKHLPSDFEIQAFQTDSIREEHGRMPVVGAVNDRSSVRSSILSSRNLNLAGEVRSGCAESYSVQTAAW